MNFTASKLHNHELEVMGKGDVSPHGPKICGEASGDVMLCSRGSPFTRQTPATLKTLLGGMMVPSLVSSIIYLPDYIARVEKLSERFL